MNAITGLLDGEQTWPLLDDALAEAALGDSGSLHEAIDITTGQQRDPDLPETTDANLVINCTDSRPGPAMALILGSGHLLTWDGFTRTAYGQTDCVTDAVDAYLVDLVVPDDGATCPAV